MTHKTFAGFREGGLQRHASSDGTTDVGFNSLPLREDRAAVQFDAPVTPCSARYSVIACPRPPRAGAIPRAFSASARARQGRSARALYLSDDWQHVGGMAVRVGADGGHGGLPGASQFHTARFGARQSVPRPGDDHAAFLLCQCGEQVQNERVNVRAKLGNDPVPRMGLDATCSGA
jgi:hypothetical protein